MTPKVSIKVTNTVLYLAGDIDSDLQKEIQTRLSYVVPGYKFMPRYKEMLARAEESGGVPEWDGTKTIAIRQYDGQIKTQTGLFSYIWEILSEKGISVEINDQRLPSVKSEGWSTTTGLDILPEGMSVFKLRDYQQEVSDLGLNKQRGVMKMSTGCHKKGQGILMYDGSIIPVENIKKNDLLMGPDGTPRSVLNLIRGNGKMVKIIPVKGTPFIVNEDHVLTLVRANRRHYSEKDPTNQKGRRKNGEIVDVRVREWLKWSKFNKHIHKLFRTGVDFHNSNKISLDPYFLGLWLGDGIGSGGYVNPILDKIKELGLFRIKCSKKFIPHTYKISNRHDRLEILAGLLDSDGSYHHGFDFISKSKKLTEDVAFICRSLGFAAYIKRTKKRCQTGAIGVYWRLGISGNISEIPCRIDYKMATKRKQKKNVLRTGFKIEPNGRGNFYGFTLSGDGRYLLDDFTVTHNSGKTETVIDMIVRAGSFPAIYYVPSCDLLEQAYDRFRKYCLYKGVRAEIGRIGAGHCDLKPITIATVQSCERALTGKFTKYDYDDVDEDDETKFNAEQKRDIVELIREAQFVYSDEAQHTSAETIQTVLSNSYKARYRIGGSASPWRDDGLDILIEACFGRRFCDVTASFLIKQGYLIKPHIIFNHFRNYLGKTANFNACYKQFVVENKARNQWIASRAQFHVERNRPTFIIVKWSKHAEILADHIGNLFKGCEVLTSSGKHKLSPKKRKEILEKMRTREIMCCIGTSLLDEGVDVPVATAGIMAGGGKSSTRALQRVGRLIRPDPGDPQKDTAYIEEIYDHCRWLDLHAKARRRIYQTEPEFFIGDNRDTLTL